MNEYFIEQMNPEDEIVVLSMDIGIKNLACCVQRSRGGSVCLQKEGWFIIDTTPDDFKHTCEYVSKRAPCDKQAGCYYVDKESKIEHFYCNTHSKALDKLEKHTWKPLNRNTISNIDIVKTLYQKLDEYIDTWRTLDYIIIEKQPPANPKMKSIMFHIFDYFIMRMWVDTPDTEKKLRDLQFIDAKHKVSHGITVLTPEEMEMVVAKHNPKKNKYAYHKAVTVAATKKLLRDQGRDEELAHFEAQTKKDDYADCYLQLLWWLAQRSAKDVPKEKKERKPRVKKGSVIVESSQENIVTEKKVRKPRTKKIVQE
jgi:hypothetical protein